MISEIYFIIKGFTNRLKDDHISAFSAQAAFFLIMSIVPFLSLLLTLIKYLPISQGMLLDTVINVTPVPFEPLVTTILEELFAKSNGAILSVSVLVAIWSAAKGVLAIVRGLQAVYHVNESRNYFVLRFISAIYTVIFVSAIILTLLLLVFSNQIYYALKKDFPVAADFISVFIKQKFILALCLLTLFFLVVYKLVRRSKNSFISLIPGAVIAALSWIVFSYAFSVYIDKFSDFSYTYGSLTTIVLLMLWVYFCMYLLFIGAEINSYFEVFIESSKHKFLKKIRKSK
ncbi:MAG: YihY/virulence factor BrkB family protein [Lachnospiraceae bacterium]|nr:YihY/virulence factor BrkB family protein [Clostridiales bacterium]MDD6292686.1 YihY/virulence factor BrkB family protein [Eubacteriales bacterium]MDY2606605.1 YihY/virulence factor BrkB family protein [Lachnospiraceae bacterium]